MAITNETVTLTAPLKARATGWLTNFIEAAQRRKVYRTTVAELSQLSDRDLGDLGINRCEIKRIAKEVSQTA